MSIQIQSSQYIARAPKQTERYKELQSGGVDMHKLSIVGKGYHTQTSTQSVTTIPAIA